jgi:transketolase
MDDLLKKNLAKIADTIRILSMDAVQKANSGHPGLPMGCAEIGAYLFGHGLKHNPKNPNWENRDRFVLSAGHGSMLLYSCLHLAGFDLALDDIEEFRQLHSKTPGHPEKGETPGVEVTTGPLGQGFANAVGLALGSKILAQKFNTEEYNIFDNKVFCLASDGDIMEGVTSEASSFAGHLQLDNLIVFYDCNNICLDGPTFECLTEDTKARYRAYGFDVYEIDAYDFEAIEKLIVSLREKQTRPVFILAHTIIGKGSPNKADTHKAHGSPLGEDEVKATKEALNLSLEEFYIPQQVIEFFHHKVHKDKELEESWMDLFRKWSKANPELFEEYERMHHKDLPVDLEEELLKLSIKNPIASRDASNEVLNLLAEKLPGLYGGSADLSSSDKTMLKNYPIIEPKKFTGRNIKFGVREFGMGAIINGLSCIECFRPYCGTFLTFSDYMRNSIRLASLSKYRTIYQFTHDSIFLGEDGPTHQPIEHLASLRAIPNLHVLRPGDSNEVKMSWLAALSYKGPSAIILCRQKIPELEETKCSYKDGVANGAYIIKKEKQKPDFTLMATGSELFLALDVAHSLEKLGKDVRVISFVCWELFEEQSDAYKRSVIGGDLGQRVCIEAASDLGWHKYIGMDGIAICMESFGLSAPAPDLAKEFGFTADEIVQRLISS